jgi:hypothetical protein
MAEVLNDGRLPGCPGFDTTFGKLGRCHGVDLLAPTSYVVLRAAAFCRTHRSGAASVLSTP